VRIFPKEAVQVNKANHGSLSPPNAPREREVNVRKKNLVEGFDLKRSSFQGVQNHSRELNQCGLFSFVSVLLRLSFNLGSQHGRANQCTSVPGRVVGGTKPTEKVSPAPQCIHYIVHSSLHVILIF
jgi:hypothetical protein